MKTNGAHEFTYEMYEKMKKAKKQERVIREEQDPEIKEAWSKMNVERLFAEFEMRPIRSTVNEMAESFRETKYEA